MRKKHPDASSKGYSHLKPNNDSLMFSSPGYVHPFTRVISAGGVILTLSVQVQQSFPPVIIISSYCIIASVSLTD